MLKIAYKKLTYKTLFSYSLVIIGLLIVAVPVVAANNTGNHLLKLPFVGENGTTARAGLTLNKGLNVDHLNADQERWYVFSQDSLNDPDLSWVSLALRYEGEALLDTIHVNFEVFAQPAANGWFAQPMLPQEAVGLGVRSPLQNNPPQLFESFWSGKVDDQTYYVRVFNNSPFGLDYSLEVQEAQPSVSGATPASIGAFSEEAKPLNARQLAWTLTAQAVENMAAPEATVWMQEAQAVGWLVTQEASSTALPKPTEANPQTLWRLTAQAIEGLEADVAAQWLIQADSLGWLSIPLADSSHTVAAFIDTPGKDGAPLLPPSEPIQPNETGYVPISIYPNQPLDINLQDVNSGRLAPYGEHWYRLVVADLDEELIEDAKLTMFFTPRKGYISDRINFEIFPASQYHIWARGDADYMENLGLGMWTSRDEDPNTGERLWNGTLVDGDEYLVKVKNGTPDMVDYYLYANDIENAELGNPIFHQSEAETGYVPYAISPPTRMGR